MSAISNIGQGSVREFSCSFFAATLNTIGYLSHLLDSIYLANGVLCSSNLERLQLS